MEGRRGGGMEGRKDSCLSEGSIGIEFREMTAVKWTLERSKEQLWSIGLVLPSETNS